MTDLAQSRQASFSEILGLVVGGGAVAMVIAAQVLFVAWLL